MTASPAAMLPIVAAGATIERVRTFARFRLPDGAVVDLGPGDLIGRHEAATLTLDDARISEAHALVSLRGRELKLLALRGRFAVSGRPLADVELAPGLRIALALDLELFVEAVVLPSSVLALEGDELPAQVLTGVTSVVTEPRLRLVARYDGEAAAHVWSTGSGWSLRLGGASRALRPGDSFDVGAHRLRAVLVNLDAAAGAETRLVGGVEVPLRLVASFDTVQIHRDDRPPLLLSGHAARVFSELVSAAAPIGWEALARTLWPDADDRGALRQRWDPLMSRLRRKLAAAGVRADLLRADGAGHLELVLTDRDRVEDRG